MSALYQRADPARWSRFIFDNENLRSYPPSDYLEAVFLSNKYSKPE